MGNERNFSNPADDQEADDDGRDQRPDDSADTEEEGQSVAAPADDEIIIK